MGSFLDILIMAKNVPGGLLSTAAQLWTSEHQNNSPERRVAMEMST